MAIIINPGSEPVNGGNYITAFENILQWMKDCEVPFHLIQTRCVPSDGRYMFVVKADDYDYEVEVEMPGIPIDKVRYMNGAGQNPFDYKRVYVDGSSWLWCYSTVKKAHIMEYISELIEQKQHEIEKLRKQLEKLEG